MAEAIRVAVTGAAGQVAYAMLGRLASGEVFGPDKKVILQLLEITPAMAARATEIRLFNRGQGAFSNLWSLPAIGAPP